MGVADPRSLEVLSPAGSLEHVRAAIEAGADAVYIGIKGMSARPDPWGFDLPQALDAARVVHAAGKRIYFALNAGYAESQASEVVDLIEQVEESGCDALIVGDWGMLKRIQAMDLHPTLHASSLLGVYNAVTVRFLRQLGVSRIILNTNLFLDEAAVLIRSCPGMEFEMIAYGGVCFNDQRRCRLPHVTMDGHYRVGCDFHYIVTSEGREKHQRAVNLHMPDTDLTSTLALYVDLGITSFKIEGRTRSRDYVAGSTATLVRAMNEFRQSREADAGHYVIHPADTGVWR